MKWHSKEIWINPWFSNRQDQVQDHAGTKESFNRINKRTHGD